VIFAETRLAGAYLIDLERQHDERGFFARCFCEDEFRARGLVTHFPQCNVSYNRAAGTLRGLHFQRPPHAEAKLIRCTAGAIWDVIVDLRRGSPTRLEWLGVELAAREQRMLYVPEGFAHGFVTLAPHSEVHYLMGARHEPSAAAGVRWDDPALAIEWPRGPSVISPRDASFPDLGAEAAG
jgi:dTDP-4-dehydrorhamnose 3,5-epimerase